MTTNEHANDRTVRVVLGVVLLAAWALGWISGAWGVILGIVGAVLLLTGAIGFCPLYRLFGIATNRRKAS